MMAYELEDLCELKEEYDKKIEKYFLAKNMNGKYLRFTEIRITSKIQDESVDMPINGDLFRKIMDLVLDYYKVDLKEMEEKIKSITDCLIIESSRKESEKKITAKEFVDLIKQSFEFASSSNDKKDEKSFVFEGESMMGETSFWFKTEQYPINEVISELYRIIYERGDIEDGKCIVTNISHLYMHVSVFKKGSSALNRFEKRNCRWCVLNGDDID